MNEIEYKNALDAIQKKFENKRYAIMREYALTNNPYKIGDVFQDHTGKIKIEKIKVYYQYFPNLPLCYYEGIIINKDGSFSKKKENKRSAFLSNEIKEQKDGKN